MSKPSCAGKRREIGAGEFPGCGREKGLPASGAICCLQEPSCAGGRTFKVNLHAPAGGAPAVPAKVLAAHLASLNERRLFGGRTFKVIKEKDSRGNFYNLQLYL